MEICTLASGSSGNSLLVSCGATRVLLDAGISARRITTALRSLGIAAADLTAILVTHGHSDHISGLATLTKQLGLPIYASCDAGRQISARIPGAERCLRELEPGGALELGALWVQSFPTPHDAAGSMGFALSGDGVRMALATDLGHLTDQVWQGVRGADLLVAETNHDPEMLLSGPYPYYLKQRILGQFGHLSNEAGAELAARAVQSGTRTLLLAHLSAENNTPARARDTVCRRLSAAGVDPVRDLTLAVAPRSECGPVYRLERGSDVRAFSLREAALC